MVRKSAGALEAYPTKRVDVNGLNRLHIELQWTNKKVKPLDFAKDSGLYRTALDYALVKARLNRID